MNKIFQMIIVAALSTASIAWAKLATLEAQAVMAKGEEARRLSDVQSSTSLTNIETDGSNKVKTFTWWRKLAPNNVQFNTLTRFHTPIEIRDEAILFLEKENGQAEVLLYLPAYKKTRRVENQGQSQGFMGSQFSYADIATPHLNDYIYKMLPVVPCHDGGECYQIEATPKTEEIKERLGYSRQVQWVRGDNFMISKSDFYDLKGQKLKELTAFDTKEVEKEKSQSRWLSHRLEMTNVQNSKKTKLEFSKVKVNQKLSDSLFTPQNLSRK